jgi:hypothetical protein
VGGAEATQNGFGAFMPATLQLKSAIISSLCYVNNCDAEIDE